MQSQPMNHGSQTIQQQGRLIEVGKEAGSVTGEHCKGEGWKMAKKPCKHCGGIRRNKWGQCPTCIKAPPKPPKPLVSCIHCSKQFQPRHGEKNLYCSNSCFNEYRIQKWLPCSICMATIGFGSQTSGRLLGITDSSIRIQWKKRGIVSNRPKSGSIATEIRKQIAIKEFRTRKCNWEKIYAQSRMEDIRSHSAFPDWSIITYRFMASLRERRNGSQYSRMTPEQKAAHNSKWRTACPIKRAESLRRWKDKNKNCPTYKKQQSDYQRKFKRENPDKSRAYQKKARSNPKYKARKNLRKRLKDLIRSAITGGTHTTRYFIGCSTAQLAAHLQSQFKRGMTWDNYGTHWHVDHILPVASFDHTDPRQVAQCWHWTNLRPLEAKKNLAKGCRITEPQMQLLLCATH